MSRESRWIIGSALALIVTLALAYFGFTYIVMERTSQYDALAEALIRNDPAGMKALVEGGVDRSMGRELLHTAAMQGHTEVLKSLLDQGFDVNHRDETGTPLIAAALMGRTETVRLLLDRGAEINDRDGNGRTALILASRAGHAAVIEALLARGADWTVRDNSGRTALVSALQRGHTGVVHLLQQHGAKE